MLRDEKWEECFIMTRFIKQSPDSLQNPRPQLVAVGIPNIGAFYRVSDIQYSGPIYDVVKPGSEIGFQLFFLPQNSHLKPQQQGVARPWSEAEYEEYKSHHLVI